MSEVLLVAAMERELFPIPEALGVCCGIGPIEAALATTSELTRHSYRAVRQIGIAGAVILAPGSVVIGSGSVYSDILDENSTAPRVASLTAPEKLLASARDVLPEAHETVIATTARVGGGGRV